MPHIAVLDPGTRVPELDAFNRMSRQAPLPLSYHLPAQLGMDSLHRMEEGLRGVVIFGSAASVHDDEPWLRALSAWLRPRLLAGMPSLGLCFGHQLLGHLLGGEVGDNREDGVKLRGSRRVSIGADRLWGEAGEGLVVVSHREAITRLPPECSLRGRTEACAVEAFTHDRLPIAGIQAHPEATTQFTENNGIPFEEDPALLAYGHGLVDRFVARVAATDQGWASQE